MQKPSTPTPNVSPLSGKITQIASLRAAERDIHAYLRDLLTDDLYGINLRTNQVVIDRSLPGARNAPDLAVYLLDLQGTVLCSPDHAVGVVEVEPGSPLKSREEEIREEKARYVQTGTKAFYLIDQERVIRYDMPGFVNRHEWLWSDLEETGPFKECFEPLSAERASLSR